MTKRRVFDRGFLLLCVVTSLISIVILAILLASILLNALPTFGAHVDTFESETRWVIIQGDESANDPEAIDRGDVLQALFVVKNLDRGGLGKSNDTEFGTQQLIGISSYEVESVDDDNLVHLIPARGGRNVVEIANRLGAFPDETWANEFAQQPAVSEATTLLLENPSAEFDLTKIKVGSELFFEDQLAGVVSAGQGWSALLVGGHQTDDFSAVKFNLSGEPDSTQMEEIRGLKVSQKVGEFRSLISVLAHNLGDEVSFKPVKLRPFNSDEIATGHMKFDGAKLSGIKRRERKNNFTLSGKKFDFAYCPIPEVNANTSNHVSHFLKETNKSKPSEVGIGPALTGTLWVCLGCALFALPLGIGTAIFLEEFKPKGSVLRVFHSLVQLNITNLAGVPSIVYGILGLTAFAGMFGLFGIAKDPFLEVGARHYYQYLSASNKSILVSVDDSSRRESRKLNLLKKQQKRIFRTSVQGIEIPLAIKPSALGIHQDFKAQLESLDEVLVSDAARDARQRAVEAMDRVIVQIQEPFDEENLFEVAKSCELTLQNLIDKIQQPVLKDGMEVFSANFQPMTLNVVQSGEPMPTDEAELAVTLRATAVGGPMSKKEWYYFQLPFGRSVLAASLTLMLVILPVIIIASQEALRAVPSSLRECALGLGSTPWQVVRNVTLPAAIPSIMTGAILAMSRAIGEAAPILVICGILFVTTGPSHLMDVFSILPVQIYDMAQLPKDRELMINAHNVAAAGIVVLLVILLSFNAVAITIRQWTQKPLN